MKTHRTKFDPNKFIFEEDICRIKLYDRDCNEVGEAIIDIEDYEKVKDYKWSFQGAGYVRSTMAGYLHHVILGFEPKGHRKETDHINGKKFDNRKINLRICSPSQNRCNIGKRKSNKSGVKGVYRVKNSNRWRAAIYKNGEKVHLGYYGSKEKAGIAYRRACVNLHGEFANYN